MPIEPSEVAPLIRRFAPVLHLHRDERFIPSDAKRYMEQSELWTVEGRRGDNKSNWGGSGPGGFPRQPKISAGSIAAVVDEPGTFVGAGIPGAQELFLNLTGWADGNAVTGDSGNDVADLNTIVARYGTTVETGGQSSILRDSRFWHHAEFFNDVRLRELVSEENALIEPALEDLGPDPAMLCYYFFFPGSDGVLEGCSTQRARHFESHAGQWTCMSLLLRGAADGYTPLAVGLSCRSPNAVRFTTDGRSGGMEVFDWDLISKVGPEGRTAEHPIIFVAKGTHALYRQPGPQSVKPFPPGEVAGRSCGNFETADQESAAAAAERAEDDAEDDIALGKLLTGAGIGGVWGGPLGALVGAVAAIELILAEAGGMANVAHIDLDRPEVAPPQVDHPPAANQSGIVIHPAGILPPDIEMATTVPWRAVEDESTLSTSIGERKYSLMVSAGGNPFARPTWLRNERDGQGFKGRWGCRVTQDPMTRRAGMVFPDFATSTLEAFAQMKSR